MKGADAEAATDAGLTAMRCKLSAGLRDTDAIARVHRTAEAWARVPRGSPVVAEFVADVIHDTYCGSITWNAERVSLPVHLLDEVRRRIRRLNKRWEQHVSIDELTEQDTPLVDQRGANAEIDEDRIATVRRRRIEYVRERISDDPHALQLIALSSVGVIRKRDVLRLGISEGSYRGARARLAALFREATVQVPAGDTERRRQPVA